MPKVLHAMKFVSLTIVPASGADPQCIILYRTPGDEEHELCLRLSDVLVLGHQVEKLSDRLSEESFDFSEALAGVSRKYSPSKSQQ